MTAGDGLRDRLDARSGALVFGALGVVLVGAGLVVPDVATLLFVWGGTALFVALLLGFVMRERAVPATVTSDIYTTMAANTRRQVPNGPARYVPDADGVALRVGEREFDPIGERLLATRTAIDAATVDESLAQVADILVNEVELAGAVRASVDDSVATVTVTGSRVGTAELFDHPVSSMVGVCLASHLDRPVRVDTAVEDDRLVVTCDWAP